MPVDQHDISLHPKGQVPTIFSARQGKVWQVAITRDFWRLPNYIAAGSLKPATKIFLAHLLTKVYPRRDHVSDEFQQRRTYARETGLSASQVSRALTEATELGYIGLSDAPSPKSRHGRHYWEFYWDWDRDARFLEDDHGLKRGRGQGRVVVLDWAKLRHCWFVPIAPYVFSALSPRHRCVDAMVYGYVRFKAQHGLTHVGVVHRSRSGIARDLGIRRHTVARSLERLEAKMLIARIGRGVYPVANPILEPEVEVRLDEPDAGESPSPLKIVRDGLDDSNRRSHRYA